MSRNEFVRNRFLDLLRNWRTDQHTNPTSAFTLPLFALGGLAGFPFAGGAGFGAVNYFTMNLPNTNWMTSEI